MCVSQVGKWFGVGNGTNALAQQQLQIAQQNQSQAAAQVAASKGDTEASRQAAEGAMRKAAASSGFASTVMGAGGAAPVAFKSLFGS